MKYSNKPRHHAPHKPSVMMPNQNTPGHKSMGGKSTFETFEDALAFIIAGTRSVFTRRKEALAGKK